MRLVKRPFARPTRPQPAPVPLSLVTTYGEQPREPGVTYLTPRDLPMPRHPDVTVFGDWHPPPWTGK